MRQINAQHKEVPKTQSLCQSVQIQSTKVEQGTLRTSTLRFLEYLNQLA